MRDVARLKSSCSFSAAAADRSSNTLLLTLINPLTDRNVTADGVLLRHTHHDVALQEVCRNNFQRQQVCKSFSLCFASMRPFGFKPKMPLPRSGPADERHQSSFAVGGKETCATLLKAVNVLSHNSQAQDLGICLCGKALAGHGGTSIISACLPGGACVEITAPINKQSPSVEIFIQTELHPCGGLSEHSSCTLKGYSESHIWARVHLEINGVPLTGWVLSATQVH